MVGKPNFSDQFKDIIEHYKIRFPFTFSAVVGMGCTSPSQCTYLLSNTDCLSSQCACDYGYNGTICIGKARSH